MDRERLDLAIDRELRRAMAITPSPEFAVRAHARLADVRPRRLAWQWPAAAAACAAAVLLAVMTRSPALTVVPRTPAGAPQSTATAPAVVVADAPVRTSTVRRSRPRTVRDVEVIVPRGQADAIRRFAERVNTLTGAGKPLPMLGQLYEGDLPQVPTEAKWSER